VIATLSLFLQNGMLEKIYFLYSPLSLPPLLSSLPSPLPLSPLAELPTYFYYFLLSVNRFERFFGKGAYAHFCVTQKMKEMLHTEWGFPDDKITVLYDRPHSGIFHPLLPEEKSDFLQYFSNSMILTLCLSLV
jgi:hypothetical protein